LSVRLHTASRVPPYAARSTADSTVRITTRRPVLRQQRVARRQRGPSFPPPPRCTLRIQPKYRVGNAFTVPHCRPPPRVALGHAPPLLFHSISLPQPSAACERASSTQGTFAASATRRDLLLPHTAGHHLTRPTDTPLAPHQLVSPNLTLYLGASTLGGHFFYRGTKGGPYHRGAHDTLWLRLDCGTLPQPRLVSGGLR